MDTDLTPEVRAKRVAVARDVLAQLERQDVPLKLRRGTYLCGEGNRSEATAGTHKTQADYLQSHCQACMIGAAFLSYSRLYGGTTHLIQSGISVVFADAEDMIDTLSSVFDPLTLQLIESVFEQDNMAHGDADDSVLAACRNAARWGVDFDSTQSAVKAICESLIAHDGVLVIPTQEPADV